jgi:transcriptional regulator with XRE-family HTH domain
MTVALASPVWRPPFHHMADDITDQDDLSPARQEQKRLGLALRRMREGRRLTQAQAAERFNVSTQAWQRYESGERRFTEHKMLAVVEALGGSVEELMRERARLDAGQGSDVVSLRQPFAPSNGQRPGLINELAALLGPHADRMRVDTDALSPWAESGELIVFDRERPPRRGHGCVVEMDDGSLQVWIFEGRDAEGVHVRSLYPEPETHKIDGARRGVYAVRFRGD